MITQQCNRCKKKEVFETRSKPTQFASVIEPYCIACNSGWLPIEQDMKDDFTLRLNTRRDKYFRLEAVE